MRVRVRVRIRVRVRVRIRVLVTWPSMVKTGSVISCLVIGQWSDEATPSTTAAAAASPPCFPSNGSEKLFNGCFLSSSTSCIDVPREERSFGLAPCDECEPLERGECGGDVGVDVGCFGGRGGLSPMG